MAASNEVTIDQVCDLLSATPPHSDWLRNMIDMLRGSAVRKRGWKLKRYPSRYPGGGYFVLTGEGVFWIIDPDRGIWQDALEYFAHMDQEFPE